MDKTFTFTVNGEKKTVTTDPERPLLEVLREDLLLTGPKYGCGEGLCGACSVLVDGKAAFSCITTMEDADNKTILTNEDLAKDGKLLLLNSVFPTPSPLDPFCEWRKQGTLLQIHPRKGSIWKYW